MNSRYFGEITVFSTGKSGFKLIIIVGASIARPRADTRVIPLLGEMSRVDKRIADVLRLPLC